MGFSAPAHATDPVDAGGHDRVAPAGLLLQGGELVAVPGGGPGAPDDQPQPVDPLLDAFVHPGQFGDLGLIGGAGLANPSYDGGFEELFEDCLSRASSSAIRPIAQSSRAARSAHRATNSSYDGGDDTADTVGQPTNLHNRH
jgi:hypothetical protein